MPSDNAVCSLTGRKRQPVEPPALETQDAECAICFETLESGGGAVPLPCDCRIAYCARCWDRALAASMTACGRALCPSCRTPMHVDFNAAESRLCFSRVASSSSEDNWRQRLYAQAKPLQIELLQRYGEECPGDNANSTGSTCLAERSKLAPRCICGSRLECTAIRDRVLSYIHEGSPLPPLPSQFEALMYNPPVVCDICSRSVRSDRVWSCANGRRTVLHAAAYDVCDTCFRWHAHGDEPEEESESCSVFSEDEESSASPDEWGYW